MKSSRIFIAVFVLLLPLLVIPNVSFADAMTPQAKEGILVLQNYNEEIIKLSGQWEFYWKQLLEPGDFEGNEHVRSYVTVPHIWKDEVINESKLESYGYATYRLKVSFPNEVVGKQLAISLPMIASNYRVWVNGELIGKAGTVGTTAKTSIPKNSSNVISFIPDVNEVEFVIQVSNFVQRKSGIWLNPELGPREEMINKRQNHYIIQGILFGCLLLSSIYHFVTYVNRKKERKSLFFSLTSLGLTIRILFIEGSLSSTLFPYLSWDIAAKLEYLGAFLALTFFNYYLHYFLEFNKFTKYLRFVLAVHIVLTFIVFLTPVIVFSKIVPFYMLFIIVVFLNLIILSVRAVFLKTKMALWNFLAILLLFSAIVNDILYYESILQTTDLTPFGLFVYVIIQAILLAKNMTDAYNGEEKISRQLSDMNSNLEKIVSKRTNEIVKINRELQESLDARIQLISSITHEMRSPLTTIKGFTEGMVGGYLDQNPKYIQIIHDETNFMERMLDDLFELSLLELGQYKFYFEKTEPITFFNKLFQKYKFEVSNSNLEFHFKVNNNLAEEVNIDPIRIEQVFINLVRNALKNTEKGSITVELNCTTEFVTVSIIDTGSGISSDILPTIFTKFVKGENLKNVRSTGIGLSICQEIMMAHGGNITVSSNVGQGSTFTFMIPTLPKEQKNE